MGLIIAAVLWGFAEATLFFIVPDVLLSAIAIRDARKAFLGCLWAVAGAAIGGMLVYFWGRDDPANAAAIVEAVPAINAAMMARVHAALESEGVLATVLGPLSGTPFKVYAVQAASVGIGPWSFLAVMLPARLPRFLLVTLIAAGAARLLAPRVGLRTVYAIWLAAWTLFYTAYFVVMA